MTARTEKLERLFAARKAQDGQHMTDLFDTDSKRAENFSLSAAGLFIDYSKTFLTGEALSLLIETLEQSSFEERRAGLFNGGKINTSEDRAVWHTRLRTTPFAPEVESVLQQMERLAQNIQKHGITDIVNVGIGGSSLGPELVTQALSQHHKKDIHAHFVSNIEPSQLNDVLAGLMPERTLFIITSKTFTTQETMTNAAVVKDWLQKHLKQDSSLSRHLVAVTASPEKAVAFGIAKENIFEFRDWVGGRYSLWSAVGLPIALTCGMKAFKELLSGAETMDTHFKTAPLNKNAPVILALLGIWHRNICGYPAQAIIPYHNGLRRLPAFLQQLDMESNGKGVTQEGKPVTTATGSIIFGEAGTDAQHSFFQWLHQGTDIVPVDFILPVTTKDDSFNRQNILMSHCLAQSEALMVGQQNEQEPHRHFNGNRPSTTILLPDMSAASLGALLALYEHKVFVQGVFWGINSFDQWGVELGKSLAGKILTELDGQTIQRHDASTTQLIQYIKQQKD